MINEEKGSIITPFIERLFILMDKQEETQSIPFDEFWAVISAFCLYSSNELLSCKLIFSYIWNVRCW